MENLPDRFQPLAEISLDNLPRWAIDRLAVLTERKRIAATKVGRGYVAIVALIASAPAPWLFVLFNGTGVGLFASVGLLLLLAVWSALCVRFARSRMQTLKADRLELKEIKIPADLVSRARRQETLEGALKRLKYRVEDSNEEVLEFSGSGGQPKDAHGEKCATRTEGGRISRAISGLMKALGFADASQDAHGDGQTEAETTKVGLSRDKKLEKIVSTRADLMRKSRDLAKLAQEERAVQQT